MGLRYIARYLKNIRTKRLVMQPNINNLRLDLFADADFVGLFAAEDDQDPISLKSRTGLLLNFGGVLILWSSKILIKRRCGKTRETKPFVMAM